MKHFSFHPCLIFVLGPMPLRVLPKLCLGGMFSWSFNGFHKWTNLVGLLLVVQVTSDRGLSSVRDEAMDMIHRAFSMLDQEFQKLDRYHYFTNASPF